MVPVPDDRLAGHLGLAELRVGVGRIGADPGSGPRVLAWWAAHVCPSFDGAWAVGAVHEEEWTGGPEPDRITVRGFVADAARAAVSPLEADAGLAALAAAQPFRVEPTFRRPLGDTGAWCEMATLDGLGYQVRWQTRAVRAGSLAFANPRAGWLVDLERALFRFARRVVAAAAAPQFEPRLEAWAAYREPLRRGETADAERGKGML